VHRWDQRGCGRSDRRGPYAVARSLADLDAVRRHHGLARMALLGHSWGAELALRYTLAHPGRVTRLVYVSGTGIDPEATWRPDFERSFLERLGTHLPRWQALRARQPRSAAEERELLTLQLSTDFADPDRALEHAERETSPFLGPTPSATGPSTPTAAAPRPTPSSVPARPSGSRSCWSTAPATSAPAGRSTPWNAPSPTSAGSSCPAPATCPGSRPRPPSARP
jgi:pimeloyl-ACP methyl ester carboxylesterase